MRSESEGYAKANMKIERVDDDDEGGGKKRSKMKLRKDRQEGGSGTESGPHVC